LEKTNSLTEKHAEFIRLWEGHLSSEEVNTQKSSQTLWTIPTSVREKSGTCINGLSIINETKVNGRFSNLYTLGKATMQNSQESHSFVDSTAFSDGDPVIISLETSTHPLAIGFIQTLNQSSVVVYTDKPIRDSSSLEKSLKYKIDKDQYSSGVGMLRGNLLSLFNATNLKLKRLIVDLEPPRFHPVDDAHSSIDFTGLNRDQKEAILRSMVCMDYTLILGMPGTGIIAHNQERRPRLLA
jgi:DNA replication ATP-dependent helicase Dna2